MSTVTVEWDLIARWALRENDVFVKFVPAGGKGAGGKGKPRDVMALAEAAVGETEKLFLEQTTETTEPISKGNDGPRTSPVVLVDLAPTVEALQLWLTIYAERLAAAGLKGKLVSTDSWYA